MFRVCDLLRLRAWPEGKEAISLLVKDRHLLTISSANEAIDIEDLTPEEEHVLVEGLANVVLMYQNLCNSYADEIDALKPAPRG